MHTIKRKGANKRKGEQNGKHVSVCSGKPQTCDRLHKKNKERAITLSLITLLSFHIVKIICSSTI
jgi:hypothetical protein